jgi:feruloyl-CoA synthase
MLGVADQNLDEVELLAIPKLKEAIAARISKYNAENSGSSARVARLLLMTEPPSADGNEITDKGYVNQAATLARRSALVDRLYADPPDQNVMIFETVK